MTDVTKGGPSKWRREAPSDEAWRPNPTATRVQRALEQDEAAGGRESRLITLPDGGRAAGSIYLRRPPKSRRVYAYLRWSHQGRTIERYVCEAAGETRAANLRMAWARARGLWLAESSQLTEPSSWASSTAVRNSMRGNKARDTRPEMALRRAVHALGMRYRVNWRPVPAIRRTADLVFPGRNVAVFLDGCFWHGCEQHYRPASRNSDFWSAKVDGNRRRDTETDRLLRAAGWTVLRIWEHEEPSSAAERIAEIVQAEVGRARREDRP